MINTKREVMKRRITSIFERTDTMLLSVEGIGKYRVLNILRLEDKTLRLSINTVKNIVHELVGEGVIVCANPEKKRGHRFKLRLVSNADKI